jgi:MMPL family
LCINDFPMIRRGKPTVTIGFGGPSVTAQARHTRAFGRSGGVCQRVPGGARGEDAPAGGSAFQGLVPGTPQTPKPRHVTRRIETARSVHRHPRLAAPALLIARVKAEIHAGLHTGLIRALGSTGGVVTSTGQVFAFTMLAMLTSDLRTIGQVGSTVCIGLLLDTLIVRSFVVPSILRIAGPWF